MTGSAYQAQLVAQLRAAEDELAALRPLRRQLADAQAGTAEREALLTEARDLLEPWGGHGDGWPSLVPAIGTLIGKLNDALTRVADAEAAQAMPEPATTSDHVNGTANVIKERGCPPDCTTAHTYEAPCTADPLAVPNGSIPYLGSGRGMWAWTCGGADWCDGMSRTDYSSAADARRAYDRHVRHAHAESLPATHESRVWEDEDGWHASCTAWQCPAYVDNVGGQDDAEQWAAEHKARP